MSMPLMHRCHDKTALKSGSARWLILPVLILLLACGKEHQERPDTATLEVKVEHRAGGELLQRDSMQYENEAGQTYEVTKLEYYISDIHFKGAKAKTGEIKSRYIRDERQGTRTFALDSLRPGTYDSLTCFIGVPPDRNVPNGLPSTVDNENMTWPEPMGGGYHFVRLEGRYKAGTDRRSFALHLGKDVNLIRVTVPGPFTLSKGGQKGIIAMEVNEWFRRPHLYDLTVDPNYTMDDSAAMAKLSDNGENTLDVNIKGS